MFVRAHTFASVTLVASILALGPVPPLEGQTRWIWFVDDDALNDPGPGDPGVSDPDEDGSPQHPFDAIQEGINAAADAGFVLVLDGILLADWGCGT